MLLMSSRIASNRLTAPERREQILKAAAAVFAYRGYEGASTETIARMAGISQPYLFKLFRTKRDLLIATIQRCFAVTEERFEDATAGLTGQEALDAIAMAYFDEVRANPLQMRVQMQSYAACDDPAICAVVGEGFGRVVRYVSTRTGVDTELLSQFFATGMLMNVLAMIGQIDGPMAWAQRLTDGCRKAHAMHS
jgi:AcrR family transcriptional regulator